MSNNEIISFLNEFFDQLYGYFSGTFWTFSNRQNEVEIRARQRTGFFSRFPDYEFENPDIGAGLRDSEKTRV